MRGVAEIVTHSLYFTIAIVALILVYFTIAGIGNDISKKYVRANLEFVSDFVKNDILRVYSIYQNSNSTPSIPLEISDKISGKKYIVDLSGSQITVRLGDVEVKNNVSIDMLLQGSASLPASLTVENGFVVIK